MSWVQFPFPTCPGCTSSWLTTRHQDCAAQGSVELDPDKRQARCDGCFEEWRALDTKFFCKCGRQFTAAEVDSALNEMIRAATLLADIMERNRSELARIRRTSASSFRSWLQSVVTGVAETLGTALGTLVGSVIKSLFG